MSTITKITGDVGVITLTLGQLIERCKRMCGGSAGSFNNIVYREWIDGVMGELFGDANQKWIEAESQFETDDMFQGPTGTLEIGKATFTENDETVTFEAGTVLPSDVVGKKIQRTGDRTGYEIVTRTSDTELEMKFKFMKETATDVLYKIVQDTSKRRRTTKDRSSAFCAEVNSEGFLLEQELAKVCNHTIILLSISTEKIVRIL